LSFRFDDIAEDSHNSNPGKIFNKPNGPDVYEGVKIDYKGLDVNPENFVAVLQGKKVMYLLINTKSNV
jgi:legumain